jgi:hypothetical protein
MDSTTLDRLTQRLDRLERENRWLKRVGAAGLIGLAGVLFMGAALAKVPDEVRAKAFVVVDDAGIERARLFNSALMLVPAGKTGLMLYASQDHISLSVVDKTKRAELNGIFQIRADGGGILRIPAKDGTGGVRLFAEPDGTSGITLLTQQDKVRGSFRMDDQGRAGLYLTDDTVPRAMLVHRTVGEHSSSFLLFYDKDGKVIWSAP